MIGRNIRIVFVGDSITQSGAEPNGYVWIVEREFEKQHSEKRVEVIGAGVSGNKIPDLQKRLERDVLSQNPTLVVIYMGINDVWHSQNGNGIPLDLFETGLRDVIKRVNEAGAKVILCTPSVIGEKIDGSNELDPMLDQYSAVSRKVASETDAGLLDLRRRFQEHLKAANPMNLPQGILTCDGVHLNEAGNDFVARQMLAALGHEFQNEKEVTIIRHIVLFKFEDDVEQATVDEIVAAFGQLPGKIDQMIGYEAGTNVSPEQFDQGFTHAFIASFRDAAGRDAYLSHPAHQDFVRRLSGKVEKVLVFDFATN